MSSEILDGRVVADRILASVADRSKRLTTKSVIPHLVFVTVGDSPPAQMYANRLERLAVKTGIDVSRRELPLDVDLCRLDEAVTELNDTPDIDGIIVQMPLPDHLTSADLSTIIDPRKDVDGITVDNAGRLYLGLPGRLASTPVAMMEILAHFGIDPFGKHAVVIGRSNVVGHPVAELLLQRDATVTVAHRQTRDLQRLTREAEILMVGAGHPHLVTRDMVSPGVVIVDAGINVTAARVVGDVDFDGVCDVARAVTPVPGGVGPVNNAVLLRNVVDSAEERP